ncbi:MAG: L-2-amino-thiazoline-4-carboxylic acid hydrolase [Paracoccaceae bacterium]
MAEAVSPILERRRIEAGIVKPIYEELVRQLGAERARAIISAAVRRDAVAQARNYAESEGGRTSLLSFQKLHEQWKAGGALEMDVLEETEERVSYNVTRCRYAEMYREMGLSEIGHLLSCGRDSVFCTGYDPDITLERTQTIMQGASHCDFRYRYGRAPERDPSDQGR